MLSRIEKSWRILSRNSNLLLYQSRVLIPQQRFISSSPLKKKGNGWARRMGFVAFAGATIYIFDRQFNASSIGRSVRTLYTVCSILISHVDLR